MKPSDYKISLDILESQSQYSLPMKKGETARVVYITLREGGVPYEIGEDCFAVLSGRKSDGTVLENNCVIKGNTIIYAITPQTTSASGLVDCEIKLYGVDNGLICSARFSIIVDERVVSDEEVKSSSEFSALTELYSDVVKSENARVVAEQSRVTAEEERAKSESVRKYDTSAAIAAVEESLKEVAEATDKTNAIADTLQTKLNNGDFKGDKGDKGDMPTDVANAIKGSVSGSPIVIDDVSPIEHTLDVKVSANETVYVRGKNLIPFNNKTYNNGRYKAGQTYQMSGVNFTINEDGSVTLKGTSTAPIVIPLIACTEYKTGIHTVTLSGSPEGASVSKYCLRLEKANATGAYGAEDYGNGKTIENVDLSGCSVSIIVISGTEVDATFYPMLEFGNIASDFVSPCESDWATADENGVVNGVKSVATEMSIFTKANVEIECTYNCDTAKIIEKSKADIEDKLNGVKEDIEKLGYRLINTTIFEEDAQSVVFSTDAEGNALKKLKLSKMFILFTGSFTNTVSKQPLCLRCNGGSVYLMYKDFSVTADKLCGFWMDFEKVFSLPDRTIYKSSYPVNMLLNFSADTELAQGLVANNVAVNSDLSVSNNADFNTIQFGCANDNNLIKSGSKVYLFGV